MKKIFANLNFPLLILMLIYSVFGLIMVFSASSVAAVLRHQVPSNYFFLRQAFFIVVGFIAGIIILHIPTKYYRRFIRLVTYLMIFVLVVIFAVGTIAGGARSWFDFGIFNMQPIEPMKIVLIIYYGVYYRSLLFNQKKKMSLFNMAFPLLLAGVVFVLVALQPDLGGAFIIAFITLLVFMSLPFGKRVKRNIYKIAFFGILIVGVSVLALGKNILHSYQVSRVLNFTEPCKRYSDDTGYQVCNGYIAIHNGGLWGVGLGDSSQKYLYLPEAHTDFIFPIIVEELGLVVGILVVIGYFVMLFIVLNIAKETKELRNSIIAYGLFAYYLSHILINLMGVLGLIPLTGVPLPFLSYGGSYNICVIFSMFILQRIHVENKHAELQEKIRNL